MKPSALNPQVITLKPVVLGYAKVIYAVLAALSAAFLFLTVKNATNSKTTPGNPAQILAISASIVIPEIIIWFIAARGALRLKSYATRIRSSHDGNALDYVANALLLVLAYVVLLTTVGEVVAALSNTRYLRPAVFISNHLPLAVILAASAVLFIGTKKLSTSVTSRVISRWRLLACAALFGLFAAYFAWVFQQNLPKLIPVNNIPRFVLTHNVLLFTYMIPHIITWMLGSIACMHIANYSTKTRGKLYRRLFKNIYMGILFVIVSTYCAQLLVVSNVNLRSVNIGLISIYMLLIMATAGFVMIYRGSEQLDRIERVSS